MRLETVAFSRRAVLAACSLAALGARPLSAPVAAKVEGLPFYAPGDQILLPKAGFEYWLPRVEAMRDRMLPALRRAVTDADWTAAAQYLSKDALDAQLKTFGSTASILGDEAYTAVGIKQQYAAAAQRLQRTVVAGDGKGSLEAVGDMEQRVVEFLALVPSSVVDQVRALEKEAAAAAAPPPPPPPPPELPQPSLAPAPSADLAAPSPSASTAAPAPATTAAI